MSQKNIYKEFKEISEIIDGLEIVNIISTITDSYIKEKGNSFEKEKNAFSDIYLNAVIELSSNILEEMIPEEQKDFDEFLLESGNNMEEKIFKMRFLIQQFPALHDVAAKKAAMNIRRWLKISEDSDYSELQAFIYNFGVEFKKEINSLSTSNV